MTAVDDQEVTAVEQRVTAVYRRRDKVKGELK